MYSQLWVEEKHDNSFSMKFKVKDVLFSGKSSFQHVDVVDTERFGKILLNDGLIMLTESDEFVYHDMISHVPLFIHPNPQSVLIIGGGDGGTAREVLRHHSVKKCTMVEIDEMVVEACKKFIPQTSCSLKDERLDLKIADGVEFVKECAKSKTKFDVILVDSTDPIGPAQPLFGDEFYKNVFSSLTDNGIVISQAESPFFEKDMQKKLLGILKNNFPIVKLYNYSNIGYPGGLWSFSYASKSLHPIDDFSAERVKNSGLDFNYYNADIHKGAFCLPSFVTQNLKEFLTLD